MASNLSNASISSLPEELLVRIFLGVDDQSALARLTRVTKQFYRIALPQLYSHPCLLGRGLNGGVRYLLPFTWLMIKRPDLAQLVEAFHIRGGFADDEEVVGVPADMAIDRRLPFPSNFRTDPDFRQAVDDYTDTSDDDFNHFSEEIEETSSEDAIITILLTKLAKLKRLELAIPNNPRYLCMFFKDSSNKKVLFGVEEFMLTGLHNISFPRWMGILGRPVLRRICARNIGGRRGTNGWPEEGEPVPLATFPITDIELRDCVLFEYDLSPIMRRCKELKTLVYELGWSYEFRWGRQAITELHQAVLRHAGRSLQNLCLICRWWDQQFPISVPQLYFNTFEKLTFLKVSAVLLFGEADLLDEENQAHLSRSAIRQHRKAITERLIGNLPPNLQRLHIAECIELVKRNQATTVFATAMEVAPLLGFKELVLLGEMEDRTRYKRYLRKAFVIAAATIKRGFGFTLRILPCNYYEDTSELRGWGMEEEVRWDFNNVDLDTEADYFIWNIEIQHLSKVARNGELLFTPYWRREYDTDEVSSDDEDANSDEDTEEVRSDIDEGIPY